MGGVCAANQNEKATIQCPHRKKHKKDGKLPQIKRQIGQNEICQLCLQIKEMKGMHQQAKFQEIRSMLSLTTHNQDQEAELIAVQKSSKFIKKSLNDFEVVRGLGKGAFGRVYLIKQRQNQEPLAVQKDIFSIPMDEIQEPQIQQAQEIYFQMKIQSENMSQSKSQKSIKQSNKSNQNASAQDIRETPKKVKKVGTSILTTKECKTFSGQKYYALKILSKAQITSLKQKKQAISERYILEAMDHPFIVKLHYAFQTKSRLFLIVDLLPGGELFYLLRKLKKFNQSMARFYAAEILLAIEYLHQRSIIYRDLKPQNILLDSQGHIKITDFGLSKVMYSSNQKTYSLCGTPQYMAPEVIMGEGYTQAADWFSYGSLIYDMLTGRPPFLCNNRGTMMRNLATKPVPMPYFISDQAKSLLNGLFSIRPEQRLGYKDGAADIKKHPFFKGINFGDIQNRKVAPPVSFEETMSNLTAQKEAIYLNSGGFQKWTSWQNNMESPQVKKTKQSGQKFQGFTYGNEEYEIGEQEILQNVQTNNQI